MSMNRRALWLVEAILAHVHELRSVLHLIEGGGRYIDCGIEARGGLHLGVELARVCLGDLASVTIVPGDVAGRPVPTVQVVTDHPVQACLASQYAGWAISEGKYFAMGSGPMRAVRGREPIYDTIGFRETENSVVGVLETRKPPPPSVVAAVAAECKVLPSSVTLLAAPTASLAGGVQVVARSVETAMHKLADLKFDLGRIQSAHGSRRCPPSLATTWRPSVGPTTRSFTVLAWSSTSPAMMKASIRSDRRSLRPRRVTMANHSRRSSPVTTTTFMPSIPCSSARPRSSSRTWRQDGATRSAVLKPTYWRGRSGGEK